MALGPQLKIIFMNILPESKQNELKYSLKIAFMFLSIIVQLPVPNLLLVIGEKLTALDGPWSANQVSSPKKCKNVIVSTGKRDFCNRYFTYLFLFFMQ